MKKVTRVVLIMGILAFLFASSGCREQSNVKETVMFSMFSQEERKNYISDYLLNNYGLNCSISEVKQRQVTAIKNEDDYFATARTEDNLTLSIWVSKEGKITDTFFLLNMNDCISSYFDKQISKTITDFKSRVYTELYDKPTKSWTTNDDVVSFLESEPTQTYIRLFVKKNANVSNDTIEMLMDQLCDCNVKIYVYFCDNLDDLNINEYDLTSYDISSEKKGK